MTKIAVSAIAAACALFATMAAAAPAGEIPAVEKVHHGDLDLGSKSGRATLKRRIRMAAMRVCSPDGFVIPRCYEAAMGDALKQLDRTIAEHAGRRGRAAVAISVRRR